VDSWRLAMEPMIGDHVRVRIPSYPGRLTGKQEVGPVGATATFNFLFATTHSELSGPSARAAVATKAPLSPDVRDECL
jgi:hypothetical protein